MRGKIEQLAVRDYSMRPRRVYSFPGERSGVRLVDPQDRIDMIRFKDISLLLPDENTSVVYEEDLVFGVIYHIPGNGKSENQYTFGVVGINGVGENEIVHKATEPPFSGEYDDFYEDGTFICRRCNAPLFSSKSKFDAGCG